MKKRTLLLLTAAILSLYSTSFAQSVGINGDNTQPNGSAMLDVKSTTKGMLVPRMTATERGNISTPATGLLVFQTDGTSGFYYYTGSGSTWALIGGSSGSSGTVTSIDVSGGSTGLTSSGGPVTTSGTVTLAGTLAVANGGTGTTTGSITGTSALTFAAGGSNQNVTLTPSGTGNTLLNGNVGVGTASPNASAKVEVSSTTQGFLPPRMSKTEQDAIVSPVAGLQIWCTSCGLSGELHVYAGTSAGWINIGPPTINIGDVYGGGKLAYLLQSGDPGYDPNVAHGLIAANADGNAGNSISWNNPNQTYQNNNTGATATALGTGFANTTAIITGNGGVGNYAAYMSTYYAMGGYTDWYLPSKDELNKLYLNRAAIGGFTVTNGSSYWTSSETSLSTVWTQDFNSIGSGAQTSTTFKASNGYIRPIRKF
jgi:hypothetical protein